MRNLTEKASPRKLTPWQAADRLASAKDLVVVGLVDLHSGIFGLLFAAFASDCAVLAIEARHRHVSRAILSRSEPQPQGPLVCLVLIPDNPQNRRKLGAVLPGLPADPSGLHIMLPGTDGQFGPEVLVPYTIVLTALKDLHNGVAIDSTNN